MRASEPPAAGARLLLQLQLPRGKSSGRVAVWRRLRRLEATGLAGAIYSLPAGDESRERFEWLRRDVEALGGEARLFEARPVDPPAGGSATASRSLAPLDPRRYRNRTWVTRPRPGVDRMASAWLIRSFVDPRARFGFAAEGTPGPRRSIPFDTFGADFGHQQGLCSFEVLARRFRIQRPAVRELGKLVHALDLDEEAPDPAEAKLVDRLVQGLRAAHSDDHRLLEAGIELVAALAASPAAPYRGRPARRRPPRKGGAR